MVPTDRQIKELWDVYHVPAYKQNHSFSVARLCIWFATRLMQADPSQSIDIRLLQAAALTHDVDAMAPKNEGERHPDAAVRILREHGFDEVADLVRTHPLHAILDQKIAPKTLEQKLLYLSDKMVTQSILTVDERFALWRGENLPASAMRELDAAYPKVKALEKEICALVSAVPEDVAQLAKGTEMSTM